MSHKKRVLLTFLPITIDLLIMASINLRLDWGGIQASEIIDSLYLLFINADFRVQLFMILHIIYLLIHLN